MMRIFILYAVFMFLLAAPHAAQACECMEMTEEASLAFISNAEMIFEGNIRSMDKIEEPEEDFNVTEIKSIAENPYYAKARIKVIDLYKGAAEGTRIEAYIDVTTSCGYLYRTGDYATFILNRIDDVLVQADLCSDPLPAHWDQLKSGAFK